MRKYGVLIFVFILLGIAGYGEEIVNGKKVFSKEEIIEKFLAGKDEWNSFREKNPELDFGDIFAAKDYKKNEMAGMNLSKMNFEGSNMASANLEGANLEGANLKNVNFFKAVLRRAELKDADMKGAYFDSTILFQANCDNATVSKQWRDEFKKKDVKKYGTINWR